jgi:predicted nucleic acid-binding protein
MSSAVDSSVLVAALHAGEPHHSACAAILDRGDLHAHVHAFAETFSSLTGGRMQPRITAAQAARLIEAGILPFVSGINLTARECLAALRQAEARGVRGGAIYDFLHLVAARKVRAERIYTLNVSDFQSFHHTGDPEIVHP